jgi:CHAD domain-containing protein
VLLRRRARELERYLPGAQEGDERSIHQARVASRRLRETLPVVAAPSRTRRKVERTVRRLTRALGAVRELDVALGILDEFARRPDMPRPALEDVRAHVLGERDRRRTRMFERLARVDVDRLSRRLEELGAHTPAADVHDWRDMLDTRIIRRARVLGAAIDAAGRMYAAERLHDVRIAVKKLRYALELAADARIGGARPPVARLKRAQDTLGRLNDLQVLQHHVAAVQAAPPARAEGIADSELQVLAAALEAACRHLHARYSTQLPALVTVVAACRGGLSVPAGRRPLKVLRPRAPRAVARRAG